MSDIKETVEMSNGWRRDCQAITDSVSTKLNVKLSRASQETSRLNYTEEVALICQYTLNWSPKFSYNNTFIVKS